MEPQNISKRSQEHRLYITWFHTNTLSKEISTYVKAKWFVFAWSLGERSLKSNCSIGVGCVWGDEKPLKLDKVDIMRVVASKSLCYPMWISLKNLRSTLFTESSKVYRTSHHLASTRPLQEREAGFPRGQEVLCENCYIHSPV